MKKKYESKVIVLKKELEEEEANEIINNKKTSLFKTLLMKPKKDEVHVHSVCLQYESILSLSGKYHADYFRKAVHEISVDQNVSEVVFVDGVFSVKDKSKIKKAIGGRLIKNKIDLPLEEHVYVEDEDQMFFDHHGKEVNFDYKTDAKSIENYPLKIINEEKTVVKKPEITLDEAVEKLASKLKKPIEKDVRDLKDELTINDIFEYYIPIYEARLVGPKKKIAIMRIDAVKNKVL